MARPVVALVTDFGLQDHYVGAVKGAVLAACPEANVVDVVHDLPPHDVPAGALALECAHRAFPAGTVFIAVVDPEVGSERRALAAEAGGYRFVGPDNGILAPVLSVQERARVHAITNAGLYRYEVSHTFHARDVFAPVAGRLAGGMALDEVGPPIDDFVTLPADEVRAVAANEWEANVLHVDRFGNLTTSMTEARFEEILRLVDDDPTEVVVLVEGTVLPIVHSYSEVSEGEPCALVGSSRRLEVAVNRGNASRTLGAGRGAPVRVRALPARP